MWTSPKIGMTSGGPAELAVPVSLKTAVALFKLQSSISHFWVKGKLTNDE